MQKNFPTISTQKNLKENQSHGDYSFPVDIHMDYFPVTKDARHNLYVPLHWHPEVEFHYQIQGSVQIRVELTEYILHPGEVLWINAKQLHNCRPLGNETAISHTIIFDPSFIYGSKSSILFRKYVHPLLGNPSFPALFIRPDDPEQQVLLDILYKCGILQQEQPDTWELQILSYLANAWGLLWKMSTRPDLAVAPNKKVSRERKTLDTLLDYIHANFTGKISLNDLAQATSLSAGECGRLCKRLLHQTPMNYLMSYRIEQSIPLLVKTEATITEIALQVGFSGASYYTEIFHRIMGITPSEYRNLIRGDIPG